jgi:hypothetical protein
MEFTIQTNEGEYDLSAQVRLIGADILVAIWGGEKPHIGAVAAAQSSPSLKNPKVMSTTTSVLCYSGHKEDELAKSAAKKLAAALDTKVVVIAGIHWDNISQEGIMKINQNSDVLVMSILKKIQSELGKDS